MRLGDSIATFMHRLAEGDRVVVVLSEKYLHSPFCIYELYHIWVLARYDKDRLKKRIRVFTQKDAKIDGTPDRAAYAKYWDEECASCVAATKDSFHLMDPEDQREISNMREFASQVAKILRVVKDTFQPRNLDELERYAFNDGEFDD
jgi:internalin A